ncbi:MAG: hemerythrin domain-containing protein [Salegentibacter sp.]|uniref:Hemerythrin HHE cation binding domain-containing protein n=1 Tax=Salegentibacter flavus TaxID=287099 RepID=A0A1I5CAB3_9FLAO|nr:MULTISPECIES: hemerythrin domain-containing protein [Salegentibacter]MDR9457324.1 hemerythrin domain-containing protein [Salegentibacter sp.]SFN83712.1 Hemerythrin HHE cation binding domain-containing protein [Salegentibacter flavus]
MKSYLYIILSLLFLSSCRNEEETAIPRFSVKPEVPAQILKDHNYFLDRLKPITSYEDSTGIVAKELYEVMEFHFKEEEDYVLPPLGILPLLAKGELPEESAKIIQLTEKFRENRDAMLAEHQMIGHFLSEIMDAARRENHPELSGYDKALEKHAELEEEILFPAVLLIGDYLKIKEEDL